MIPTFNGKHLLTTVLGSVRRHWPDRVSLEVVVVDDASTDDSVTWVRDHHPEVRVVQQPVNTGFCSAANAGIAAARGRFIQLLNNDTEVTAGWIEAGLEPFSDPLVGAVAPLVHLRHSPERVDSAGDEYSLVGVPYKRGHLQPAVKWMRRLPEDVLGASASSAFYRGSLLRRLGGFNPAFGSYYEDVELAFRLRWAGYRCVFTPRCVIYHDGHASYDHARPTLQRQIARNAERLFWTCLPASWIVAGFFPRWAMLLLQLVWRLCRGKRHIGPKVLGRLDALRDWRAMIRRRQEITALAKTGTRFRFGFPAPFPLESLDSLFGPAKVDRPERVHADRPLDQHTSGTPAACTEPPHSRRAA